MKTFARLLGKCCTFEQSDAIARLFLACTTPSDNFFASAPAIGTTFAEARRGIRLRREIAMKRREFLKMMTALAAGSAVPLPAIWSPARAQARQETLLIVSESGPNNLDIHGTGTKLPGY